MNTFEKREVTIEGVTSSISGAVEATLAYDKAYEQSKADGGYEWDYYGYRERERRDGALTKLQETLDSYIDARVAAALKQMMEAKSHE